MAVDSRHWYNAVLGILEMIHSIDVRVHSVALTLSMIPAHTKKGNQSRSQDWMRMELRALDEKKSPVQLVRTVAT